MSTFEIFFGLSTVILGLTLTEMAASVAKLLRAGRKVRWALEPVIQAALIVLIVVTIWTSMYALHNRTTFTIGEAAFQVVRLLAIYVAAAAVFGEAETVETVDLKDHYYASRRITYGALTVAWLMNFAYFEIFFSHNSAPSLGYIAQTVMVAVIYVTLAIVRRRWLHFGLLLFVLIAFAATILTTPIK